jgi:hypothetical protein
MFTAALSREASLKFYFKESLALPREIQVSFVLPREAASLVFLRGTFVVSKGACAFGFTTSFADVNTEQLNTQVHFDTNSTFFVCDNSTTDYICNDI